MKISALKIERIGGPDVLQMASVDLPAPAAGEVRIAHRAVGVNFIDIYQRSGVYAVPLPFTPGMEGAGVIDALGDGVVGLSVGQRVVYCSGPLMGSYAQMRNMPAHRLIPLPDDITFDMAASMMLKGLTAHYLIHDCYRVEKGSRILLHAAAGGVGSILSQWAAAKGAEVIGTAGGAEKVARAKAQGCAHVIDYRAEHFVQRVRDITGGKGVDCVYDSVGQSTFLGSLDCLRPRGTLVSFGQASGKIPPFDIGLLSAKGSIMLTRPTLGDFIAAPSEMLRRADELFAAVRSGIVRLTPPRVFALEDAAQAHAALEGRETIGAIILKP